MFACVSPHFHKDVILRERKFDLEYLSFFRDVYLIQDTELTFPPFSTHYLHCRFLRGIMWQAMLRKVTGVKRWDSTAGWGVLRTKTLSPSLTAGKSFHPLYCFLQKFKSTKHITSLLSQSSFRWEVGVFSLICIWRKWVVLSWMTPITLFRKVLGICQVGLCDFWQETRVAGVAVSLFSLAEAREC